MKKSGLILLVSWCLMVSASLGMAGQKELRLIFTAGLGDVYYAMQGQEAEKITSCEELVTKERRSYPEALMVDLGNFSRPSITTETPYVARPIRQFQRLGYNAVNLGPRELILADNYFKDWQKLLPSNTLVSNLLYAKDSASVVSSYKIERIGGFNIGIIGLINGEEVGFEQQRYKTQPDITAYTKNLLSEIKGKTDLTVILSSLNKKEHEQIIAACPDAVSLILVNQISSRDSALETVGHTLICSLPKAEAFFSLVLKVDEKTKAIKQQQLIPHDYPKGRAKLTKLIPGPTPKEAKLAAEFLPAIGQELNDLTFLKQAGFTYDELEAVSFKPDEAVARQIKNSPVVFYRLHQESQSLGSVYHVDHRLGQYECYFNFFALVDNHNKIKEIRFLVTPYFSGKTIKIEPVLKSILDKSEPEIAVDLSQLKGVEKTIESFLDDIKLVLKINQQAPK